MNRREIFKKSIAAFLGFKADPRVPVVPAKVAAVNVNWEFFPEFTSSGRQTFINVYISKIAGSEMADRYCPKKS